jgi:hypothetical protein
MNIISYAKTMWLPQTAGRNSRNSQITVENTSQPATQSLITPSMRRPVRVTTCPTDAHFLHDDDVPKYPCTSNCVKIQGVTALSVFWTPSRWRTTAVSRFRPIVTGTALCRQVEHSCEVARDHRLGQGQRRGTPRKHSSGHSRAIGAPDR